MARSLSNVATLVAASVADGCLALSIFRRGYAAAGNGAVSASFGRGGASRAGMIGKVEERVPVIKEDSGTWAPDPITGYYRPANCAAEIDPAELREMLLNHRVRPH